jgi:hypothetical protein
MKSFFVRYRKVLVRPGISKTSRSDDSIPDPSKNAVG